MRSEIEYPGLIIAAICHEVFPVKFYNHIWAYTHARPTMKLRLRDYTNTITLSKPIEGMRPKPIKNFIYQDNETMTLNFEMSLDRDVSRQC